LHLQPSPPGWLDLGLGVPLMRCDRARRELDWEPRVSSLEALLDLLRGIREGVGGPTLPLGAVGGGSARIGELVAGSAFASTVP